MSKKFRLFLSFHLFDLVLIAGCDAQQGQAALNASRDIVTVDFERLYTAVDTAHWTDERKQAAMIKSQTSARIPVSEYFALLAERMPTSTLKLDGHILTNPRAKMLSVKALIARNQIKFKYVKDLYGPPPAQLPSVDKKSLKRMLTASFDALEKASLSLVEQEGGFSLDAEADRCNAAQNSLDNCMGTSAARESMDQFSQGNYLAGWLAGMATTGSLGSANPNSSSSAFGAFGAAASCNAAYAVNHNGCKSDVDRHCPDERYVENNNARTFTFQFEGNTMECSRQGDQGTRVLTNRQPEIEANCPDSAYVANGNRSSFTFNKGGKAFRCGREGPTGTRTLTQVPG